ncbi:MAG: chorismate mutase [Allosphingosinicella sp.]
MYRPRTAQRPDPERDANRRELARLRAQIDALDDNLLDLVERRLTASQAIAARKSARGDDQRWRKPRRVQEVIARLVKRASVAPTTLVEHVWRELMAYSLQVQVRTELVLHGPDPAGLKACARRRFGSAAPVRIAATTHDALTAAVAKEAVAVIALDEGAEWVERLDPRLAIFDWIRDEEGEVVAAAVGRIAVEDHPDHPASQSESGQ